ncbi:MAG: ABC transporter ATP-binding protein [Armatimonadetes bacterium]|nr:ABC transporter ATP-binding protein [Armatimonadota bacterium]
MSTSNDALVVDAVSKIFDTPAGRTQVLREVNLQAWPGDTVAIVGPSGSGKSTLLNIIGSLEQPTTGTVTLGDTDVTSLRGRALAEFRARRVGFVFQDHHLLPQLTALENVLLPSLAIGGSRRAERRARELLERMGVAARAEAFPARLSGGERQRVAAARALVNGAGLLLCDEPTGNLDRETGAKLVDMLIELAARDGVIVLMVTHNEEQAGRFERCMALRDGTLTPHTPARGAEVQQ